MCTSHVYPQRVAKFGQHGASRATQRLGACAMQSRGSKANPLRICCNELCAQPGHRPQGRETSDTSCIRVVCSITWRAARRLKGTAHSHTSSSGLLHAWLLTREQQTLQAPLARPGATALPLAFAGARSPAYTFASRAPLQGRSCA